MKLTATDARSITRPGRYADGAGLYLIVSKGGSKSWSQRITVDGKKRDRGLGPYPRVSIKTARSTAAANRDAVRLGRNPFPEKKVKPRRMPTFGEVADDWFEANKAGWKSAKYRNNITSFLKRGKDAFRNRPINEIEHADVQDALKPIWRSKHETAKSCKENWGRVFRYAIARGHITHNPTDAAELVLGKVDVKVKHMTALPYSEVPAALTKIREAAFYPKAAWPVTCLAFEFLVFTATRGGDVRGATWDEFDLDLDAGVWTIRAERMKMSRPHRVPLSRQAVYILQHHRSKLGDGDLVFESPQRKTLSENAFSDRARKDELGCHPHGFRSSFRDWCAETRPGSRDAAEMALAHVVGNQIERAYRHTDLLDQRRELMQAWADFCDPPLF